jgi:hypothetical protein
LSISFVIVCMNLSSMPTSWNLLRRLCSRPPAAPAANGACGPAMIAPITTPIAAPWTPPFRAPMSSVWWILTRPRNFDRSAIARVDDLHVVVDLVDLPDGLEEPSRRLAVVQDECGQGLFLLLSHFDSSPLMSGAMSIRAVMTPRDRCGNRGRRRASGSWAGRHPGSLSAPAGAAGPRRRG